MVCLAGSKGGVIRGIDFSDQQDDRLESNVRLYIQPLVNSFWFVVCFVVVLTLGLYLYFLNTQPVYQSSATIMVAQNTPNQTLNSEFIFVTSQLAETFARVAKSEDITKQVAQELGLDSINKDDINILVIPRTQLMKITVKDYLPQQAANIANQLIDVLSKKIAVLQEPINPNNRAILEIVESASPSAKPAYPRMKIILVISLIASLVLALAVVYLEELFDIKIRNKDDVSRILPNVPILATFPVIKNNTDQLGINQMRILRNNLLFNKNKATACLALVSHVSKEGRTYILSRLGMFLAKSGKKVLLIDADFTRSGLTTLAGFNDKAGLFDLLTSLSSQLDILPIHNWFNSANNGSVDILPTGNIVQSAREAISSLRLNAVISELHRQDNYDFILIDTPPLSEAADALAIAPKTNGIILIIESSKINNSQLNDTKQEANLENFNIFGVIINKAKRSNIT